MREKLRPEHAVWHKQAAVVLSLFVLTFSVKSWSLGNEEWQVHGFVSQAYLKSSGNNFYGDSKDGSTDFHEAGVNARYRVNTRLDLSAQLFTRDAGGSDNGDVNVDYFFADYKLIEQVNSGFGVRAGRVRNPYGLYNQTRDVIFTRTSVLMPQAIYFEGNGLREILFSSDGLEIYGHWDDNDSNNLLSLTLGTDKSISREVIKNLLGTESSSVDDAELQRPVFARYVRNLNGGEWRLSASTLFIDLYARGESPSTGPLEIQLDASSSVLSVQRNAYRWSVTGEFSATEITYSSNLFPASDGKYLAYYVQSQYRFTPTLSFDGRYEYSLAKGDGQEDDNSDIFMAGLRWKPSPNWLIAADVYRIQGTLGIPIQDNKLPLRRQTDLLALMIGWRF